MCSFVFFAKRDDKCCPAMHSFETRTCSAEFWVPAFYWCCKIPFVIFLIGILCLPIVFSGFAPPCGFPVKAFEQVFSYLDLRHQNFKTIATNNRFFETVLMHEGEF